jgi:hypothetical protein
MFVGKFNFQFQTFAIIDIVTLCGVALYLYSCSTWGKIGIELSNQEHFFDTLCMIDDL